MAASRPNRPPRSPFATQLSGSAKDTELRIRSIFSGPKKRPSLWLMALAVCAVLFCGGLVSCQPVEESVARPTNLLSPYPLDELGEGKQSLLLDGREILIQVVPNDSYSVTGRSTALRLWSRDPATGREFPGQEYGLAETDWEGTGLFPFSDLMGYNGFLLRYLENGIHTVYLFFVLNESGFSTLFACQDNLWLGDLDGDGQEELLTRSDYDTVTLYHRTGGQEVWAYPSIDLEAAARSLLGLEEDAAPVLHLQTDGTLTAQLPGQTEELPVDPALLLARMLELEAAPTDAVTLQNLNLDGVGSDDDSLIITCCGCSEAHPAGLVTARAYLGTGAELYWEYVGDYWLLPNSVRVAHLTDQNKQTVVLELPYAYANWEGADYFLLETRYGSFREVGCMTGSPDGPLGARSLTGEHPTVFGSELIDRADSPLNALRVPTYVDKFEDYLWYTLTWDESAEQFRCEPQP